MKTAKIGDAVKVHYTGKLNDDQIFDSSEGKNPLEFTIGQNQVLKKFEDSVEGLSIGEETKIFIPAAEAYGDRQENLIVKLPKDRLPETLTPEIGMRLQTQTADGNVMVVKITEIAYDDITIDANHELAGQDLHFDIKLVEIV